MPSRNPCPVPSSSDRKHISPTVPAWWGWCASNETCAKRVSAWGSEAACKVAPLDGVSAGAVPIRGRHRCFGCSDEQQIRTSRSQRLAFRFWHSRDNIKETSNMIESVHTAHMEPKYMINTIFVSRRLACLPLCPPVPTPLDRVWINWSGGSAYLQLSSVDQALCRQDQADTNRRADA